jgi:excisionase family DNA binding protein
MTAPRVRPCTVCGRPLALDGRHSGPPAWLSVAEVAELLTVSRMTIYRLVHGKVLHAVQVGAQFRISATSVDHYIHDNTTGGGR